MIVLIPQKLHQKFYFKCYGTLLMRYENNCVILWVHVCIWNYFRQRIIFSGYEQCHDWNHKNLGVKSTVTQLVIKQAKLFLSKNNRLLTYLFRKFSLTLWQVRSLLFQNVKSFASSSVHKFSYRALSILFTNPHTIVG